MSIRTGDKTTDLRDELNNLIDEFGLDGILSQLEDICRDLDGYNPLADSFKTSRQLLESVDDDLINDR